MSKKRTRTVYKINSSRLPGIKTHSYSADIKVVGVGGGGCNAVSRMRESGSLRGIDFLAINTDAQDLDFCSARKKIYIGKNLTKGLGAGMNPELGRQAAEENRSEISESLKGADLVFITAGLGGGTGSGASPVIAETAREAGALTVAIVTKPFAFEGAQRSRIAIEALNKLKDKVDTFIVIPNDRIFTMIAKDTPILKAFEVIDGVLRSAVSGIAELVAQHGLVNVDFADVKAIMQNTGSAVVSAGIAFGQERAMHAVNSAINSPLMESSIEGARSVLFGVSGGRDLKMNEVHDIAKTIGSSIDQSAKIIFGAYYDKKLKPGALKVTLIATNFGGTSTAKSDVSTASLFAAAPEPRVERASSTSASAVKESPIDSKSEKEERTTKPASNPPKGKADIFDIPTFLRRRRDQ